MNEDLAQRSRTMKAVKGRDTGPEMMVRRIAHRMAYRYRLHRFDLAIAQGWDSRYGPCLTIMLAED